MRSASGIVEIFRHPKSYLSSIFINDVKISVISLISASLYYQILRQIPLYSCAPGSAVAPEFFWSAGALLQYFS